MTKSRFFRLACALCCVGLLLIATILLRTNSLEGMEMNVSLDRVQLAPVSLARPAPQENLWIELYNKNTLVSFN